MAQVEINKADHTTVFLDNYPVGTYFIYTIAEVRHPVIKTYTGKMLDLANGSVWEGKGGTLEVLPAGSKITITVD